MAIPIQSHPFNQGGLVDIVWRRWLEQLDLALNSQASGDSDSIAIIARALGSPDGTVANIPSQTDEIARLSQGTGISITGNGTQGSPYVISLAGGGFVIGMDAADFTSTNPTLALGSIGWEIDTGQFKFADGVTDWTGLDYFNAADIPYDPTTSGLSATDVQAAVDALAGSRVSLKFTTDTGSTADSDPGAGLVKWDNATQSSATKLFFNDLTADTGTDLSAYFAEIATSSVTGVVHMVAESGAFKLYKWTAIADGTGYFKFTVSHLVSSGGNFADNIPVRVAFYPIGLKDAPSNGNEYVRKDGEWVPAAGGGGGVWTLVKKTSETSRASTTTMTDDPDLQIAIPGAGSYVIRGRVWIYLESQTAGINWKFNFTGTTSSIVSYRSNYTTQGTSSGPDNDFTLRTTFLPTGSGSANTHPHLTSTFEFVIAATSAGTLSFQWAQLVSNASATHVYGGSYLEWADFS